MKVAGILFLIFPFCICQYPRMQTVSHYSSIQYDWYPQLVYKRGTDVNNLPSTFSFPIVQSCFSGSLVFYEKENYDGEAIFLPGVNKCVEWKDHNGFNPKSQKFIGSTSDFEVNGLNIFQEKNYKGYKFHINYGTQNSPNYSVNSFILTGSHAAVTLYSNYDYQGFSLCIRNTGNSISIGDPDFEKTTGMNFTVRSIKFGCASSRIVSLK